MTISSLEKLAGLSFKTIEISGETVRVRGLSLNAIIALFQEFPQIKDVLTNKASFDDRGILGVIFDIGPDFVAAIIAAATTDLSSENNRYIIDPATRAVAFKLPLDVQVDILEAAISASIPLGLPKFLQQITKAMSVVNQKI